MNVEAYRKNNIESASPHELIKIVYDEVQKGLMLSIMNTEKNDMASAVSAKEKTLDALLVLIDALDRDGGGEIAEELNSLYSYAYSTILSSSDVGDLKKLLTIFQGLSESWVKIS